MSGLDCLICAIFARQRSRMSWERLQRNWGFFLPPYSSENEGKGCAGVLRGVLATEHGARHFSLGPCPHHQTARFNNVSLKAEAKIWPRLSYMCRARSAAVEDGVMIGRVGVGEVFRPPTPAKRRGRGKPQRRPRNRAWRPSLSTWAVPPSRPWPGLGFRV